MHCDEFHSVYEAFYKLNTKPFRLSPDPQFFYPSAGHKRALSYLLYGLNQAEGFVVITGTPGTGKTTLAHKLLSQIDAQNVVVAHLASTQIEAEDLLRLVAASFKLRSENVSKAALLKDIESFLLARARERKRCLLVVDEAQNLPSRSIEELRMLSNFQIGNKALMQVFLLGQEQFRVMLDSPEFEQLRQRVIADYHLQPLAAEETRRYIEARLQHTGWQNDPEFDLGAHAKIFEYTGGLPRRINMFCDRLLLFGYLEGLHKLTHATVCTVIAELHNEILPRSSNVVFTPAEHVMEVGAATEPAPRAPEPPASVRVPSEDNLPSMTALIQAARMAPERAADLQSTKPSLAARHAAKNEEPVPVKTARISAVRAVSAALPKRDTSASDSSMADFLLDPTPHKSGGVGSDVRGLNTLDEPPRKLSSTGPSLAGTESRWLWMIVSACVVLAILVFWFYPSLHDALQRLQPHEMETARAPLLNDLAENSGGLAQQINDPSENILTENRIMAATAPPALGNTGAGGGVDEPSHENNASSILTENKPAPEATGSSNKLVLHAIAPAKTSPLEHDTPEKTKPGTRATQPAGVSAAPAAPPVKPAAKEEPLAEISKFSTPGAELPALAQADTGVSASAISQRELALLILKFTRYYAEGNLPQFLSLFDEQVHTEDSTTIDAIRADYSDLFKKTALRQISLGDIHWESTGRLAHGTGPFEVRIGASEGASARSLSGDITFHLEKKNGHTLIIGLYHKPH